MSTPDYPRQIALELPTGLRIVIQRFDAYGRSWPVGYSVITEMVGETDAMGDPIWQRVTRGTYYQDDSRTLGRYEPVSTGGCRISSASALDLFIEDAVASFLAREGVTEEVPA